MYTKSNNKIKIKHIYVSNKKSKYIFIIIKEIKSKLKLLIDKKSHTTKIL
jgi:hypothetical protein